MLGGSRDTPDTGPLLGEKWSAEELRRVLASLPPWRVPVLDDGLRAAFIERAHAAAVAPLPALPATLFLDYARTGARAQYDGAHFGRRRILRDLVAGEAIEGERRFVDRIVDVVWAICEESWWGVPAHLIMQGAEPGLPNPDDPIVDLFAAETGAALAWTVHLVGHTLAPPIAHRVRAEVRRRLLDPLDTRDDFWWMGLTDVGFGGIPGGMRIINNWNPWICSNWIASAVLVEDDADRRARAVAKAVRVLDQFLAVCAPDGSCEEGTAYWGRAAGSLFDALEMLSDATGGAVDVFNDPVIAEHARFPLRMHLAGPWFVNFGDGAPCPDVPPGVVYRYGRRIGDPVVTALGAELLQTWRRYGPPPMEALGRTVRTLEIDDEARRAPDSTVPARFTWLQADAVMVARDGGESTRGFAVAARGGHNGAPHGHNDIGSFIVALDGEPLVIDAGVGTYTDQTFGPGRFEIWTMRSGYHNVPLVAGVEQAPGPAYAARVLRCVDDGERAELALDLAGAYPDEAGIERWQRSVVLERDHGVVVADAWTLRQPAQVELHLLMRDEPVAEADGASLRFAHAVVAFAPRPTTLEVIPVPLDDPILASNWDRDRLWRAAAVYADAAGGSVHTTIVRA